MLLIYTPIITNRIRYVLKFALDEVLGLDYKVTNSLEEYKNIDCYKLNYSRQISGDKELHIYPSHLLTETGIKDQAIKVFKQDDIVAFFATVKSNPIPYDIFSCIFYMISRYEEYLPTIRDSHNRFNAHQSLAYQNKFLQKPVVDIWCYELKKMFSAYYPSLKFKQRGYNYYSTIDIDNAYAYKHKGLVRTTGAYLKSLFSFDFAEIIDRTKVLLTVAKDPYDTYKYQHVIQKQYNLHTLYFFLVGDYGVNDKNISINNHSFQSLIKAIADYAEIGIHPSYGSNSQPEKLEQEIDRLEKVVNREITKSRQHFLKITLPDTYRRLIELDITDDYSMGFAQEIGFRAGTCTPFLFYDLDLDTETKLRIHPFQVMEASLKYYMKIQPNDAVKLVKPIIEEIKKVDGTFVTLWHNETLSENELWKGWRNVYEDVVKEAQPTSAL